MAKAEKKESTVANVKVDSKEKKQNLEPTSFPIVGIGASAGGLEAIEQFLANVPEDSGMSYVVVQHLDPTHKGMLPELLQRITKMSVFQAKDNMIVCPNCVYVIPPNKTLAIRQGKLQLFRPLESRGLRLPIDYFLRSLAIDRKESSVGLILSGMGSDGSIGLRAIKEQNGIVMVQDPDSAKFDSMPRNAIESVLVDIVGPPQELSKKLIGFVKHIPKVKANIDMEVKDKSALGKIIFLLRTYTGNDFSQYKTSTMYRRIERRMGVHKLDKIAAYVKFLQKNPAEGEILFRELMIGVTSFFRDSKVWEKLGQETIPGYIAKQPDVSLFRAWVAGCSTGEEAYSLAIVFKEAQERMNLPKDITLQIFATDLDHDAVEIARKGFYPVNIESDVSSQRLEKYFVKTDEGYRLNSEIREMVVFAQHNLIMHPPFINIDFLSCRNLLIYLENELQKKILGLFYYSLNNEGVMILGSSETLGVLSNLFNPVDNKLKIYKRSTNAIAPELLNFPTSFLRTKPGTIVKPAIMASNASMQTLADQLILQQFSPPGVLVNDKGDILYISGRIGKYLEPAAGKANLNVFSMLREGLRNEFHFAFRQVITKKKSVVLHHLKIGTNGSAQTLNISIEYIDKPGALKDTVMVIFTDVADIVETKPRVKSKGTSVNSIRETELEKELNYTREEMLSTMEEMQTSEEELKSTNEELQSANEEMQSANEELTSSKEEMQSLNEELQTLNAELMAKVEDFARVDNDMKNLLNSTDIATLFLDKELNIRRYTNQATKIIKLIKSDIGRPFTDQVSDIHYPQMADDAKQVLRTLAFVEKQIPGKDGKWFSIRLMPYHTYDDRIDGLVITFIDISELKRVEEDFTESLQMQSILMNTSKDIIIRLLPAGKIVDINPEAEKYFGVKRENVIHQDFYTIFVPESRQLTAREVLDAMKNNLQEGRVKIEVLVDPNYSDEVEFSVKVLLNNSNMVTGMMLISEGNR